MERIKETLLVRLILIISLGVLTAIAIPSLVFAALKRDWSLLAVSIVIIVIGIYGIPTLSILYAVARRRKKVLSAIIIERLYTVKDIAEKTHIDDGMVKYNITYLVEHGYLPGYSFYNNELTR